MSEQIRRCVGSIIFVPDRRRFAILRTNPYDYSPLSDPCTKNPAVFYSGIFLYLALADYRYAVLLLGLERRLGVAVTLVLQVLGFTPFEIR